MLLLQNHLNKMNEHRYILIGGCPFRHSYTGLRIVAGGDTLPEMQQLIDQHYQEMGIFLVLDRLTGEEVIPSSGSVNEYPKILSV